MPLDHTKLIGLQLLCRSRCHAAVTCANDIMINRDIGGHHKRLNRWSNLRTASQITATFLGG
jgi:hypothetical protein